MTDASKKLEDLREHPELAGTPGFETAPLWEAAEPQEWFLLLAEQPQLEPPEAWWFRLRNRCDLPWAQLLAKQPQFEKHCHWESVSRLELCKLGYLAPELFQKRFPQGRPWDLWAFLTPLEKELLLETVPQLENQIDWDELSQELSPGLWLVLLSRQPQFEKYFDWSRIEGKASPFWDVLLKRQPQFAGHCDYRLLQPNQLRRIRKHQPHLWPDVNMEA